MVAGTAQRVLQGPPSAPRRTICPRRGGAQRPQARAFPVLVVKATPPPPGLHATSCGLTCEVLGALLWLFLDHRGQ